MSNCGRLNYCATVFTNSLVGTKTGGRPGSLYNLLAYNPEDAPNEILQEEYSAVAHDEDLDYYVEQAMDQSAGIYQTLHDEFSEEADDFLAEIEKILSALSSAIAFTEKWKASKINPDIDNTNGQRKSNFKMGKKIRGWPQLTIPALIYTYTCRSNHQYHKNHSAVHTPNRINTGQRYDPAPGRPNAFGPFTTPISRAFLYPSSTVLLLMLFSRFSPFATIHSSFP